MKKTLLIALLLIGSAITAETKTNLEQMFKLIDNSISRIDSATKGIKSVAVSFVASPTLEILKPRILEKFSKLGYTIKDKAEPSDLKISYSITNCEVIYSDIEKDGFLGSVIMNRAVNLSGTAAIGFPNNNVEVVPINGSVKDLIASEEVKYLEDQSLPFTQGKIPQPSFFSNLFEPLLVVGTLVSTAILLFTIRGK